MNETVNSKFEAPVTPFDVMVDVVTKLYVPLGLDESRVETFIADVLYKKEIKAAFSLRRHDPEKQKTELLGILDNPFDLSEIQALFDPKEVSDDIKKHYGIV